jgi:ABC-type multidrug transport system permease subunit
LLAMSEPGLDGGIGIPTIALSIGFFLLLISVGMYRTERHDIVEMSSALPIAAAIMVMIGILMIAVQQPLLAADMLGTALAGFLPNFFIAAVVGMTGFILMGAYLEERRYYTISIRGLLAFGKEEVK